MNRQDAEVATRVGWEEKNLAILSVLAVRPLRDRGVRL
jgi:hypothetical protein